MLNDKQLVLLVQTTQDKDAFGELVRRHQAPLRAFLRRMTVNDAEADDIAQDAMIKAWEKIASFGGKSAFKTWLFSVAYREFLQSRRKQGARDRLSDAVAEMTEDSTPPSVSEKGIDLQAALKKLSNEERAALIFCDAMGMSNGEAADAMDAPLGSVKTYIKRARDKMRQMMEGEIS